MRKGSISSPFSPYGDQFSQYCFLKNTLFLHLSAMKHVINQVSKYVWVCPWLPFSISSQDYRELISHPDVFQATQYEFKPKTHMAIVLHLEMITKTFFSCLTGDKKKVGMYFHCLHVGFSQSRYLKCRPLEILGLWERCFSLYGHQSLSQIRGSWPFKTQDLGETTKQRTDQTHMFLLFQVSEEFPSFDSAIR